MKGIGRAIVTTMVVCGLGGGLAYERADPESAVLLGNAVEAGNAIQVDEHGRPGQAHVQRGDEALPAGQQLGLTAMRA